MEGVLNLMEDAIPERDSLWKELLTLLLSSMSVVFTVVVRLKDSLLFILMLVFESVFFEVVVVVVGEGLAGEVVVVVVDCLCDL